jgi:hypothetical protein
LKDRRVALVIFKNLAAGVITGLNQRKEINKERKPHGKKHKLCAATPSPQFVLRSNQTFEIGGK